MEGILERDAMLFIGFAATFILEILRFRCFSALGLNLNWQGGLRYPYYLPFVAVMAGLGAGLNILLTGALHHIWLFCYGLSLPWPLYACGIFLVGLAAITAGLCYVIKARIEEWADSLSGKPKKGPAREKDAAAKKLSKRLLLMLGWATALVLLCFVIQPARGVGCAIVLVLATCAVGRMLRFAGWDDLLQWIARPAGNDEPSTAGNDKGIRVRLYAVAEGKLARRGNRLELIGEQLTATPAQDPVEALAQRVLERSALVTVVRAADQVDRRDDLLAEIPAVIARNLGKLAARQEALSQRGAPPAENEARMQFAVRNLLEQELGDQLLSLLYWHYDLPGSKAGGDGKEKERERERDKDWLRFSVHRLPRLGIKPLISFQEYLGLYTTWLARRLRQEKR